MSATSLLVSSLKSRSPHETASCCENDAFHYILRIQMPLAPQAPQPSHLIKDTPTKSTRQPNRKYLAEGRTRNRVPAGKPTKNRLEEGRRNVKTARLGAQKYNQATWSIAIQSEDGRFAPAVHEAESRNSGTNVAAATQRGQGSECRTKCGKRYNFPFMIKY